MVITFECTCFSIIVLGIALLAWKHAVLTRKRPIYTGRHSASRLIVESRPVYIGLIRVNTACFHASRAIPRTIICPVCVGLNAQPINMKPCRLSCISIIASTVIKTRRTKQQQANRSKLSSRMHHGIQT